MHTGIYNHFEIYLLLKNTFLINAEIPSGPKPSINFISKNFHKNNPKFFDGLTINTS